MGNILDYEKEFLPTRLFAPMPSGFEPDKSTFNPMLFPFQSDIVAWALRKGRVLLGENCGLGKGPQLLEWGKQVSEYTGKPVLMFAPPGVKAQFKYEAAKFRYDVNIVQENEDIRPGINITNYQRIIVRDKVKAESWENYLEEYEDLLPIETKRDDKIVYAERYRFNPYQFGGVALDEGSILKHYNSKTRERLTNFVETKENSRFKPKKLININFRIVATATPAPNDYVELINYADFLGIMNGKQCIAKFFIQDGNSANKYRIKKPAWEPFWKWLSDWAILIKEPGDLGYSNDGFILPELHTHLHTIDDTNIPEGMLIAVTAQTLSDQSRVKRNSVRERCQIVADLVNGNNPDFPNAGNEIWIVWCERNDESTLLKKLIPGCTEVVGSHTDDYKEKAFIDFAQGRIRVIVTKPSMGGLGMNWQTCHNQVFTSVDHSHEKQYQAIRRSWRFGQLNDVHIHLIAMDTEGDILANIDRKEKQAGTMFKAIAKEMNIHELHTKKIGRDIMDYVTGYHFSGDKDRPDWELLLGDSVDNVKKLEDQSVGQVMTSVPFPAMYVYTNSPRDAGNYSTVREIMPHLQYIMSGLLPKTMPGRICSIHISQAVAHMNREGYIGLIDFRGPLVEMMMGCGWIFHGERTIEKDPQTERARNQTLGLLQKTLGNDVDGTGDASNMRASVGDYLMEFREPSKCSESIYTLLASKAAGDHYDSPNGSITLEMWINWASNVWLKHRKGMKWWEGIDVTNVVGALRKKGRQGYGVKDGKGKDDEKHLCELQLDVIERKILLHSNPGDLIVDPFSGIGSTGFKAIEMGRRYWGSELKDSYHYTAIKNLRWQENEIEQNKNDLFSLIDLEVETTDKFLDRHNAWKRRNGINVREKGTNWKDWEV